MIHRIFQQYAQRLIGHRALGIHSYQKVARVRGMSVLRIFD